MGLHAPLGAPHQGGGLRHVHLFPVTHQKRLPLTCRQTGNLFFDDADDLGTLDLLSFGANTIGAPLTATTFTYDPKLPAYDLLNVRAGVRRNGWEIAVFINNLTDERALLSFDQERGTRARIGYLTNQPRTFGISTRVDF